MRRKPWKPFTFMVERIKPFTIKGDRFCIELGTPRRTRNAKWSECQGSKPLGWLLTLDEARKIAKQLIEEADKVEHT